MENVLVSSQFILARWSAKFLESLLESDTPEFGVINRPGMFGKILIEMAFINREYLEFLSGELLQLSFFV